MADDRIEPIGDVQRAIGAGIQVHGAKRVVRGGEDGHEGFQLVARAVHAGTQPRDVAREITGDEKVALQILGQMRRVDNLDDHRFDFRGANLHRAAPVTTDNLLAGHHARQQLADAGPVAFDKRLAPIAKCKSPRVAATRGTAMRVQLAA